MCVANYCCAVLRGGFIPGGRIFTVVYCPCYDKESVIAKGHDEFRRLTEPQEARGQFPCPIIYVPCFHLLLATCSEGVTGEGKRQSTELWILIHCHFAVSLSVGKSSGSSLSNLGDCV